MPILPPHYHHRKALDKPLSSGTTDGKGGVNGKQRLPNRACFDVGSFQAACSVTPARYFTKRCCLTICGAQNKAPVKRRASQKAINTIYQYVPNSSKNRFLSTHVSLSCPDGQRFSNKAVIKFITAYIQSIKFIYELVTLVQQRIFSGECHPECVPA